MTLISLICFLALSSSAFAFHGQQGGYGTSLPKMNSLLHAMRDNTLRRPILPTVSMGSLQQHQKTLEQPSYGQQEQISLPSGYGSSLPALPKALPTQGYGQINQGYGAVPQTPLFDQQPQVVPAPVILTEADNLCRGKAPETIIPLDDGRRFVVCLDDSKGAEQSCPKGLIYRVQTQRCERKYGPQNYCASQPCLNGGQCIPTDSSFQCQCAAGFDGQNCELDSRICESQRPCGSSPDARCQSFRLAAALPYICIFQDGQAYGLNTQQLIANPCQDVDGPQALSISDKGFIMCDGERMFVESCPGGTVWDDNNKACVWPDVQIDTPQADQSYSYGSYGQSRQLISKPKVNQGYGSQIPIQPLVPEQRKLEQGYGSQMLIQPLVPEQRKLEQGYGSQIPIRPLVPEQPKVNQGYGSQILIQPLVPEQRKLEQGYGSQIPIRPLVPEQRKFEQGYGSQIPLRPLVPEQPKFEQGYGSQIPLRPLVPEQRKFEQGYGSQIPLRPLVPEQPKFEQGYGSQIPIQPPVPEQPKFEQGYGSKITIQPSVVEQQKVNQGYGY